MATVRSSTTATPRRSKPSQAKAPPARAGSRNSCASSRNRAPYGSCCLPARSPKAPRDLGTLLEPGDVVIDGGNSFWKDDVRRAAALKQRGLHYVDIGTSGGVWGLERGYCMIIGGEKDVIDRLDAIFAALAPGRGDVPRTPGRDKRDSRAEQGYIHAGPNGAGHFVKMVHNGIEYGLMQAYAEGFDILRNATSDRSILERLR
jgi:6-phosphogluconate dehydrogenase